MHDQRVRSCFFPSLTEHDRRPRTDVNSPRVRKGKITPDIQSALIIGQCVLVYVSKKDKHVICHVTDSPTQPVNSVRSSFVGSRGLMSCPNRTQKQLIKIPYGAGGGVWACSCDAILRRFGCAMNLRLPAITDDASLRRIFSSFLRGTDTQLRSTVSREIQHQSPPSFGIGCLPREWPAGVNIHG
jgi:hypothetical protein